MSASIDRIRKAPRMAQVKASLTLAISAKAKAMKAQGIDVVSFGAGEPDFSTPLPIVEAAKSALDGGQTRYTAAAGLPVLREKLASWYSKRYGVQVNAAQVMISTGGKQTLYNAMMSLVGAGDEVLIPAPYWLTYPAQVYLAGGTPVFLTSTALEAYLLTADALREALQAHPRAVALVLNSPSNPTGQAYSREQLAALADVIRDYPDLTVIWDNIYAQLTYEGFEHVELIAVAPDLQSRVVICSGFSKSFAMTGWRQGFAIAAEERIAAMTAIQSHSTSNATSFAQAGSLAALELDDSYLKEMRVSFSRRRKLILSLIEGIEGLSVLPPKGAFYVLMDATYIVENSGGKLANDIDLAAYMLENHHVATVPGSAFGAVNCLRLSFAISDEAIEEGLRRIARACRELLEG